MAGQRAVITTAAKWAVRYGPLALQLAQQVRGPATEAARRGWDERTARRTADEHARTVRRGTVLTVMRAGRRYWVVYAGDEPVTAYPPYGRGGPSSAGSPGLEDLVAHADLDNRQPPPSLPAPGRRLGPLGRLRSTRRASRPLRLPLPPR